MEKGWISLSRKIQDCFIWEDKPFAKGQAWIDMLLLANHSDKKFLSKNETILVTRGSFLTSDQRLGDRWGWGRKKVNLFLTLLEIERMITMYRNNKGTIINIVNYDSYQNNSSTEEQQRNSRGTAEEQQTHTNNNDNNDNNDNNKNIGEKSKRFIPPSLEELQTYCQERNNKINAQSFIDFYSSKGWMIGKNKMKDWKSAIRTWEQREKKPATKKNTFEQRDYDNMSLEQQLLRRDSK